MASHKDLALRLLDLAGIAVGGDRPWDIAVHDERFYGRVLGQGTLGLGESYMEGWWDCPAVDQFISRAVAADLPARLKGNGRLAARVLSARLFNLQSRSRAFEVGERHYDLGNDLYRAMLDRRLCYTSGYWKDARTLDEAQEAKLDLVCRKLGLGEGMSVLELGCGWGSFARYAAEKYGARVTGLTVSREQVALGSEMCRGLPVTIELKDYREAAGLYDRVVSIGILEHVGCRNYRAYMEVTRRSLKDDGIALVHTIGQNTSGQAGDPWLDRYIFPNAMLPSIAQIARSMEGLFVMEDWHNFGPHYDRTLMAWHRNFEEAWASLRDRYGERFRRMWRYYLLSSAGGFRSRNIQLWQVVMTRTGRPQPDCRAS